jgi:uncharacterized protein YhaN
MNDAQRKREIDRITDKVLGELLMREGLKDQGVIIDDPAGAAKRVWNEVKDETAEAVDDPHARANLVATIEIAEAMAEGSMAIDSLLDHLRRVRDNVTAALDTAEAAATEAQTACEHGHVLDLKIWPMLQSLVRVHAAMRAFEPHVHASMRECFSSFYSASKSLKVAGEKEARAHMKEIARAAVENDEALAQIAQGGNDADDD